MNWEELDYWKSGEWQVVQERLDDGNGQICPDRDHMFDAYVHTKFEDTKVFMVGQDPYPDLDAAMGLAFSLTRQYVESKGLTPTLKQIFKELKTDLHLEAPDHGSLVPWAEQGVLLWNSVPTCHRGQSLSHDWSEWQPLTREMVEKTCEYDLASGTGKTVFVFIGGHARQFAQYVTPDFPVIETAHPSPRASNKAKIPFTGSRIFSRINASLSSQGIDTINWGLPEKS